MHNLGDALRGVGIVAGVILAWLAVDGVVVALWGRHVGRMAQTDAPVRSLARDDPVDWSELTEPSSPDRR